MFETLANRKLTNMRRTRRAVAILAVLAVGCQSAPVADDSDIINKQMFAWGVALGVTLGADSVGHAAIDGHSIPTPDACVPNKANENAIDDPDACRDAVYAIDDAEQSKTRTNGQE
jgi:hypothetical protein